MFDGSAVEKRSVNLGGRRRDNASASDVTSNATGGPGGPEHVETILR